jgi:hypothetical protein
MNIADKIPKILNLDEYEIPKFKIAYKGKVYESCLYNFDSMIRLSQITSEIADEGIAPNSKESFVRLVKIIYPGMEKELIDEMPVSFLSVIIQEAISHMSQQIVMAPAELENFHKGIPVTH